MKIIKNNEKWLYIPDHPYRILIIDVSGSAKTNTLLNLMIKFICMQEISTNQNIKF